MNTDTSLINHTFYSPISVAFQLYRGKSLWRTLLNLALKKHTVSGRVLDIGGKSGQSSYYKYLDVQPNSDIICTDILEDSQVTYLDVEQVFPFTNESLNSILAFNLFEHVYDYQVAPKEAFRTLSAGGKVLVATPFLFPYHADPDDYFRFTSSAILRLWTEAGFQCIHLEAIGEGILTTFSTTLPEVFLPKWGRPLMSSLLYLVTTPLDRLIAKFRSKVYGKSIPERYPLGYFGIFIKP